MMAKILTICCMQGELPILFRLIHIATKKLGAIIFLLLEMRRMSNKEMK